MYQHRRQSRGWHNDGIWDGTPLLQACCRERYSCARWELELGSDCPRERYSCTRWELELGSDCPSPPTVNGGRPGKHSLSAINGGRPGNNAVPAINGGRPWKHTVPAYQQSMGKVCEQRCPSNQWGRPGNNTVLALQQSMEKVWEQRYPWGKVWEQCCPSNQWERPGNNAVPAINGKGLGTMLSQQSMGKVWEQCCPSNQWRKVWEQCCPSNQWRKAWEQHCPSTPAINGGRPWNNAMCENKAVSVIQQSKGGNKAVAVSWSYLGPSRKLQTLSSLFETIWNISLMICCCSSWLCTSNELENRLDESVWIGGHWVCRPCKVLT